MHLVVVADFLFLILICFLLMVYIYSVVYWKRWDRIAQVMIFGHYWLTIIVFITLWSPWRIGIAGCWYKKKLHLYLLMWWDFLFSCLSSIEPADSPFYPFLPSCTTLLTSCHCNMDNCLHKISCLLLTRSSIKDSTGECCIYWWTGWTFIKYVSICPYLNLQLLSPWMRTGMGFFYPPFYVSSFFLYIVISVISLFCFEQIKNKEFHFQVFFWLD